MHLAALDADRVARIGLLLVVGLVVIGLVIAILARTLVIKILGVAALVGAGVLVWSQRSSMQECMQQAKDGAAGSSTVAPCEFLGLKVEVRTP